jgi:hypothetical protein
LLIFLVADFVHTVVDVFVDGTFLVGGAGAAFGTVPFDVVVVKVFSVFEVVGSFALGMVGCVGVLETD